MYSNTITLFNYSEQTKLWYPHVIPGCDLIAANAKTSGSSGQGNSDAVDLIINCTASKQITTTAGAQSYTGPKAFAAEAAPAALITFTPQRDFFLDGIWNGASTIDEDDYESGFYNEMNKTTDGIYLITSATFYGLLPHFEIGGR